VTEEERLQLAMEGIRRMILDAESFRGWFDILPHAFREPELRARMWSLYGYWYKENLEALGLGEGYDPDDTNDLLMGLTELIAAIPDGLSVQVGLNPDGFDLNRSFGHPARSIIDPLTAVPRAAAGGPTSDLST
jgi:hypothetical protein